MSHVMGYCNAKIRKFGDAPLLKLRIKTSLGNHTFLMYPAEVRALAQSIPKTLRTKK